MLRRTKSLPTHEELFTERYQRLLSWSMQLSEYDRELAEDLLHDAFIQFTFARPDLEKIRDLDGYLYGMLRNLHLLQVRRETRNRLQQLSVVEYDSAEDGLRTIDLRDRLQVQDELRRVCLYTCTRKETAKSASVLIMRFFHGYYPSEIAHILRTSRATVDVHLLNARHEARAVLDNPSTLAFAGGTPNVEVLPSVHASTTGDFLAELRDTIFKSRRNNCLPAEELAALYRPCSAQIGTAQLAHLVSCPFCLDEVNNMLKLPPLRERFAIDSLGRKKGKKDSGGDGPGASDAGGVMSSLRRRARRVFEHKPQELCVSVNGYVQGSQRINSELNELNLNVNLPEEISCVEVFSEQQVPLLLMGVDALPPVGSIEQSSRIELSDGRTLDLILRFRSPLPALQVIYQDPTYKQVETLLEKPGDLFESPEPLKRNKMVPADARVSDQDGALSTIEPTSVSQQFLRRISRWMTQRGPFLLQPSVVTAIISCFVIAAALFMLRRPAHPPTLSPAEVLQKSVLAEDAVAVTDRVIHRTIKFEVRRVSHDLSGTEDLLASRRIEVWHSAEKGITARRLYDEKNSLVAGDWRRKDGVQTLYHHSSPPRVQLTPQQLVNSSLSIDNAWQLSPSAKDLLALIPQTDATRVEERANTYLITYDGEGVAIGKQMLLRASLSLNRPDLHATELALVVEAERNNHPPNNSSRQLLEYRYVETGFESKLLSGVAPTVFEPEPELVSLSGPAAPDSKPEIGTPAPNSSTPPARAATAQLEVEVLQLLHQTGAHLDEETTVTRTSSGRLRVTGLVETNQRRTEILRALSSVSSNPAIDIEIKTIAEAVAEQKQRPASSPSISIQAVEANPNTFPAYPELRKRFTDEEARAFATRMAGRTREALRHAWALKRLMGQFSPADLKELTPDARARWLSLLRNSAQAFGRETANLRRDLQPFFSPGPVGVDSEDALKIASDAELDRAIERLFQLGSANDQVIRSAFTVSASGLTVTAVRTPQFWRALRDAENLAERIADSRF